MLRGNSCVRGLLAGLLLVAGCSTSRKQAGTSTAPLTAPLPSAAPTMPARSSRPPPALPEKPPSQVPPPATGTVEQHSRETPAASLRRLLPKTCVVLEITPTTLLIKSGTPAGSSSLFEEAIALSKLRGRLTARPAIPKDTAQKTKLQNGTAIIPFGKSVPPDDAADAVAAALTVNGVQQVRAVLNAN